tara:strand:+ start:2243 stop:2638 length:396 start_codon:yes stop_codon:yes gene_type:complete
MALYTNFDTQKVLTVSEMYADKADRFPASSLLSHNEDLWKQLEHYKSRDPASLTALQIAEYEALSAMSFDELGDDAVLFHPYYEVTETPDPEDGSVLSDMCVKKENHIELGEDEVWDGTPVFWFETEWVSA